MEGDLGGLGDGKGAGWDKQQMIWAKESVETGGNYHGYSSTAACQTGKPVSDGSG